MNQRPYLHLSLLLALGCSVAASGPRLEYRATRLDEQTVPLPFVVEVFNSGDAPAEIGEVTLRILKHEIVMADPELPESSRPSELDCTVEVREGHPTRVDADSQGVACGFIRWRLPADAPAMLAAARCVFTVQDGDGRQVESAPIALVLQSRDGAMKSILEPAAAPSSKLPLGTPELRKAMEALGAQPAEKSPGFEALEQRLSAP